MDAKRLTPPLLLGLAFAAAVGRADTLTGTIAYDVTQTDSTLSKTPDTVGVSSSALSGKTDAHSITVRWKIVVSCSYAADGQPPADLTATYTLTSHADSSVALAGITPPSGGGKGQGDVANATSHTAASRTTANLTNSGSITAPPQTKTIKDTIEWLPTTDRHSFTGYLFGESTTQTTSGQVDSYPSTGGSGGPTGSGGGSGEGAGTAPSQAPYEKGAGNTTQQGGNVTVNFTDPQT